MYTESKEKEKGMYIKKVKKKVKENVHRVKKKKN